MTERKKIRQQNSKINKTNETTCNSENLDNKISWLHITPLRLYRPPNLSILGHFPSKLKMCHVLSNHLLPILLRPTYTSAETYYSQPLKEFSTERHTNTRTMIFNYSYDADNMA